MLLVEVHKPLEIFDDIHSTGELGSEIVEQSLVIKTPKGLIVITDCAHPGVVQIVAKAKELLNDEVYLVLGGFHLGGASESAIGNIVRSFRQLGVKKVAPCHCTGRLAMDIFEQEYGEDFISNGAGKVITIE